ncbi:MAG: ATP-binding protein [Parafannyhessea sp.]|uniref:sensor histidine kinase n=1 Tax=Parafannyhessea sp. TaxID=2847324 RepID=UPI003F0FE97C
MSQQTSGGTTGAPSGGRTIRHRLLVSNVLMIVVPVAIAALVGVACLAVIYNTMHSGSGVGLGDEGDFYWTGRAAAELVEKGMGSGVDSAKLDGVADALAKGGLSFAVLDGDSVAYRSPGVTGAELALARTAISAGGLPTVLRTSSTSVFVIGNQGRGSAAGSHIAVFGRVHEVAGGTLKTAAIASGAALLAAVVLAVVLMNRFCQRYVYDRITGPIGQLERGVEHVSAGDLSYRVNYRGDDEFGPIARSFDQMAQGLEDAAAREEHERRARQELVACISHDLRSPLTSIRGYAEGLLDGIATTPERQRRYASRIVAKTEQMSELVSQLFLFSKLDLGDFSHQERRCDLADYARKLVEKNADDYARRGIGLRLGTVESASALADASLLERAVTNVLDNAVRYAPGCTVTASVLGAPGRPRLVLADDGPGVPDEALPHLFELFYRDDPARSAQKGGSGLGLAIVRRAMDAMGGTARALRTEGGGLTIELEFSPAEQAGQGEEKGEGATR